MKKVLSIILLSTILVSCNEPAKQREDIVCAKRIDVYWHTENGYSGEEQFTILTIDSCEYLSAMYDRSRTVTHKGNCKFCLERNK